MIEKSSVKLISYSGDKMPVLGQVNIPYFFKGEKYLMKFIVTSTEGAQKIEGVIATRRLSHISLKIERDPLNERFRRALSINSSDETIGPHYVVHWPCKGRHRQCNTAVKSMCGSDMFVAR